MFFQTLVFLIIILFSFLYLHQLPYGRAPLFAAIYLVYIYN